MPRALGEVVEMADDYFGDAVNVAARLLDHAGDNETLVTSVVLAVSDPLLAENDGRYEIGPSGAKRVRRAADLDVPIDALGAIYLGGTSVTELVNAGRIVERKAGAAARADLLLRSTPSPWSGTFF